MSDTLEARLDAIVRAGPGLMGVLTVARDLDLPDWLLFSGAVYQRVLNQLTGRDLDYGIKDYDLGYFDPSDTSYEAEDQVIRRVAAAFEPPLRDWSDPFEVIHPKWSSDQHTGWITSMGSDHCSSA